MGVNEEIARGKSIAATLLNFECIVLRCSNHFQVPLCIRGGTYIRATVISTHRQRYDVRWKMRRYASFYVLIIYDKCKERSRYDHNCVICHSRNSYSRGTGETIVNVHPTLSNDDVRTYRSSIVINDYIAILLAETMVCAGVFDVTHG